jgi:FG-GAP repeat
MPTRTVFLSAPTAQPLSLSPPISFSWRLFAAFVLIFVALLVSSQLALAQFTQQGPKLVGTGAVGAAGQGTSVALSSDGNTAIVGGPTDNPNSNGNIGVGATWVYTRGNGVWTQQGSKLVGNDAVGQANQGQSVALSGDGSTAIVGGTQDNSNPGGALGAAWVFTRSGGVWTQQGSKLVGTGAQANDVEQGFSVALSVDGNTAIVGGPGDRGQNGAVWVFTRSNGVWTQQGSKLIGTGAVGPQPAAQGSSVALSADGGERRQAVYAKACLSVRERYIAAQQLAGGHP